MVYRVKGFAEVYEDSNDMFTFLNLFSDYSYTMVYCMACWKNVALFILNLVTWKMQLLQNLMLK